MRRMLLIPLLAFITPCMNAQAVSAQAVSAQRSASFSPHFSARRNPRAHTTSHFRNGDFFYPLALSDPFFSDYLSSTGYSVSSRPPVVMVQPGSASTPEPNRFPPPAQPLMIELQGDHYVRVTGPEDSGAEIISPDKIARKKIAGAKITEEKITGKRIGEKKIAENRIAEKKLAEKKLAQNKLAGAGAAPGPIAALELPPAVLVFRDGHREEATAY